MRAVHPHLINMPLDIADSVGKVADDFGVSRTKIVLEACKQFVKSPSLNVLHKKENEALESLLGQTITVWCGVYIYTGKLVEVNSTCVKLEDAMIVYETGEFISNEWKDAQSLGVDYWYVQIQAIESFGVMNKS